METKICTKCGKELPTTSEYFHVRKDSRDGFRNDCRECSSKYHKQYHQENKEHKKRYMKQWYQENKECTKQYYQDNKEKIKQYSKQYYHDNKEHYSQLNKQWHQENKEHRKQCKQQWHQENKEHCLQYAKQWRKLNKDKVAIYDARRRTLKKQLPSTLISKQWKGIKEEFNNQCAYCGEQLPLEQDHFIALSKGGEYTHNNIIPACKSCNSSKNNKDFFEWYPQQESYSKEREKKILGFLNYVEDDKQQLTIAFKWTSISERRAR